MATPLRVDTERGADGRIVLHAIGEIDASNVAAFAGALSGATAETSGPVTINLSRVDYLDSAAINALASHAGSLHIVANPLLIPVLRISGIAELAKVHAAPASDGA